MKNLFVTILFVNSLALFAQSNPPSSETVSSNNPSDADFITSQDTRLKFYQNKVNDYKKIYDCTLKAENFASMDLCNKFIEKYMKKSEEKK